MLEKIPPPIPVLEMKPEPEPQQTIAFEPIVEKSEVVEIFIEPIVTTLIPENEPEPVQQVVAVATGTNFTSPPVVLAKPAPETPKLDLSWMANRTATTEALRVVALPAQDRRSSIAVQMASLRERHGKLNLLIANLVSERDGIEFQMEECREDVKRIDDMLTACSLVAEQVTSLGDLLRPLAKGVGPATRTRTADENNFSSQEAYDYFLAHPNDAISAGDIVASAPPEKKDSAKAYMSQRLFQLVTQGKIVRLQTGIYALAKVQ